MSLLVKSVKSIEIFLICSFFIKKVVHKAIVKKQIRSTLQGRNGIINTKELEQKIVNQEEVTLFYK